MQCCLGNTPHARRTLRPAQVIDGEMRRGAEQVGRRVPDVVSIRHAREAQIGLPGQVFRGFTGSHPAPQGLHEVPVVPGDEIIEGAVMR